jgi:hypothetical protein
MSLIQGPLEPRAIPTTYQSVRSPVPRLRRPEGCGVVMTLTAADRARHAGLGIDAEVLERAA